MMPLQHHVRADVWTLGCLAEEVGGCAVPDSSGGGVVVTGICEDSRACQPGDLFVALSGTRDDGLRFARDALARGAVAVASHADPCSADPTLSTPWMYLEDPRGAVGALADLIYGDPSRHLALVGVTGTNGKTTTLHLLAHILGEDAGRIGTLGAAFRGCTRTTANTTPGPTELRRFLAAMVDAGCRYCVMEVSSHALDQRRVEGLRLAAGVYTNLSGDHLDYHGSMEAYAAAKARLFAQLEPDAVAVLNRGQAACRALRTAARTVWYEPGEVRASAWETRFQWRGQWIAMQLVGLHNVENALAALECARALGVSEELAAARLASAPPARGRLEPVQREPFLVLVDYAHTDDALEKALGAVRPLAENRLLVVFGCGGDRDRSKRGRMGAVAARAADHVFITSDNPRGEPPERICEEIRAGTVGAAGRVQVEPDRRKAIAAALRAAGPGDAVLIAGKGHETFQEVAGTHLPFDDGAVAREVLATRLSPNC